MKKKKIFFFVCAQPVQDPNNQYVNYAATILFLQNYRFVGTKKKKKKKKKIACDHLAENGSLRSAQHFFFFFAYFSSWAGS